VVGSVSLASTIRQRSSWQFMVASLTVSVGASLFFHNHGIPDLQHYAVGAFTVTGGGVMFLARDRPCLQPLGGLIMIVTGLLLFNYTSPSGIHSRQELAHSELYESRPHLREGHNQDTRSLGSTEMADIGREKIH
jgi:hypothetical protein